MSFAICFGSRILRGARAPLAASALALSALAHAAPASPAPADEPADICTPLTRIVAAADFKQLRDDGGARLPGLDAPDACRASAHGYDCRWRAHWQADGVINDPLEELGADIAACFGNAVHDVNTPYRQHFVVRDGNRRVAIAAGVTGANELRLRVTR